MRDLQNLVQLENSCDQEKRTEEKQREETTRREEKQIEGKRSTHHKTCIKPNNIAISGFGLLEFTVVLCFA